MRRMGRADAFGGGHEVDEEIAVFDREVIPGRSGGDAGVSLAGEAVEMPVMPGADDVAIGVNMTVAQWTTDMVAEAGDRAELTVAVREGEHDFPGLDLLERFGFQIVHTTEPMPLKCAHVVCPVEVGNTMASRRSQGKCWNCPKYTTPRYTEAEAEM